MTRILIIYRVDKSKTENIGVVKKLIGQVDGLKQSNCKVDYVIHDTKHIYLNNQPIYDIPSEKIGISFKWNYFNHLKKVKVESYDACIIRYGLSSFSFISFLKRFKLENEKAQLLIDMPTYPYQQEHVGIIGRAKVFIDQTLSKKLEPLVDFVLHSGVETSIFDVPTIKVSNGINCEQLRARTFSKRKNHKMIAVGKWRSWHGLDRLIKGLATYEHDSDITLDIVGDGPELERLYQLVKKNQLDDRVTFQGICVGEKLDRLFDEADIGVGTLGLFRKGVKVDSSLKNREYIARGLPIILSSKDADIKSDLSFVFKVPEDASIIDIRMIERYLDGLNVETIIQKTRSFAENHLSWRSKMKALIKDLGI